MSVILKSLEFFKFLVYIYIYIYIHTHTYDDGSIFTEDCCLLNLHSIVWIDIFSLAYNEVVTPLIETYFHFLMFYVIFIITGILFHFNIWHCWHSKFSMLILKKIWIIKFWIFLINGCSVIFNHFNHHHWNDQKITYASLSEEKKTKKNKKKQLFMLDLEIFPSG